MLYQTFLAMLFVGHALVGAVFVADRAGMENAEPPLSLLGTVVFAIVAISSENVQTVTNDGTVVTQSESAIGIYAFMLALLSFILTVYLILSWLPTDDITGGNSSGF